MIPFRRNHEFYTTPFATDVELQKKFNEVALRMINTQRSKYPSVFRAYAAEDVLSECWIRILQGDIKYDPNRGAFEGLVWNIVKCALIDRLWECENRQYDRRLSMNRAVNDDSDTSFEDFITCDCDVHKEGMMNMLLQDLREVRYNEDDRVSLCDVVMGMMGRESFKNMAEILGVEKDKLKEFYDSNKEYVVNKCYFYGIKE